MYIGVILHEIASAEAYTESNNSIAHSENKKNMNIWIFLSLISVYAQIAG